MKKYTITSFLVLLCLFAFSQEQIPNGDFENWKSKGNYEDPEGWETLNFLTDFGAPLTVAKTDTSNEGNHACEMVSQTFFNSNIVGFVFTGSIDSNTYGIPFHSKPTRVLFDYRSYPKLGDSCYFVITLSHWDTANNKRDSIAYAQMFFDKTVSKYTLADIPLIYELNNITPDTIGIYMASSFDTANIREGSRFVVDNLRLSYFPVGTDKVESKSFTFYPNPASGFIKFNSTEDLYIELYNTNGQLVLKGTGTEFDVSDLPKGIYYIKAKGESTNNIYNIQKLIIQ